MDKKLLFNEALTSLVEFAAANGNHVTKEDIHTYFKDIIDDELQYGLIYKYLSESKITIVGIDTIVSEQITQEDVSSDVISSKPVIETEEELAFIEMYMKDLEAILPADETEILSLVTALKKGDVSVTNRLIEANLSTVAQIANDYKGRGVTYGDLIQEGNMGLMLAISDFNDSPERFIEFVISKIHESLKTALDEQTNSSRIGEHLAGRMNKLDAISSNLAQELGHAPSFAELASNMGISEEEVETIVKTSLNVLNSSDQEEVINFNDKNSDEQDALTNYNEFINELDATEDDVSDTDPNDSEDDPLEWRINKK